METESDLHLLAKNLISPKLTPPKLPKILNLHLKGTPFQLQVWQALLTIPFGQTQTYTQISQQIR